ISDTDATADTVAENAAVGTAVGIAASASDADATNNAISYSLVDDDGGRFAIDSATGVVTVAAAIDRETDGASRTIIVRASSSDGSSSDRSFTIAISDVN
ncbi:MAG: cadherin repeat domain-containing protein, partial [Aureliella sp.]